MAKNNIAARHHIASLALAVLATFSIDIHAQTTITAGDTTYRGSFSTDAKTGAVNGSGSVLWKNGNRYEGPVVNTQLTGKGSFTWANGDTYVGDMVNAQPHGQGTYTFKSGDRYAGAWRNGQKHGQGRYTFANGTVWEGEFANDQQFKQGAVAVTTAAEAVNPAPVPVHATTVAPAAEAEPTTNTTTPTTTTSPVTPLAKTRQAIFSQLATLFDSALASKVLPKRVDLDNLFAQAEQPKTHLSTDACFTAIYRVMAVMFGTTYSKGNYLYSISPFSTDGAQSFRQPRAISAKIGFDGIKLSTQQKAQLHGQSGWNPIVKDSVTFVPNDKCDRVFVRNLFSRYDKESVRWTLAYADMRYSFLASQSHGVLTSQKFEHRVGYPDVHRVADFGDSLADTLVLNELGIEHVLLAPRGYEVQQKDWGAYIQDSGQAYFALGPLTAELQQNSPNIFRSQDDWPANEKSMLATWESARAKEKARLEAREAEQARLAAIESEKRRKQEQLRFDSAMNGKDPQAMYLAAGKYEREGDSYSARKVYEQIIDRFPSSPFAAKANDQLLANQRSDKARSDLLEAQQDARRQQGEAAYKACMVQSDTCYKRNNSFKGCVLPGECASLR